MVYGECIIPKSSLVLNSSAVFCDGRYYINDKISLTGDNILLTCLNTTLIGDRTSTGLSIKNADNLSINGCELINFNNAVSIINVDKIDLSNTRFVNNSFALNTFNVNTINSDSYYENNKEDVKKSFVCETDDFCVKECILDFDCDVGSRAKEAFDNKRYSSAVELYSLLLESNKSSEYYFYLGASYFYLGEYDTSLGLLSLVGSSSAFYVSSQRLLDIIKNGRTRIDTSLNETEEDMILTLFNVTKESNDKAKFLFSLEEYMSYSDGETRYEFKLTPKSKAKDNVRINVYFPKETVSDISKLSFNVENYTVVAKDPAFYYDLIEVDMTLVISSNETLLDKELPRTVLSVLDEESVRDDSIPLFGYAVSFILFIVLVFFVTYKFFKRFEK